MHGKRVHLGGAVLIVGVFLGSPSLSGNDGPVECHDSNDRDDANLGGDGFRRGWVGRLQCAPEPSGTDSGTDPDAESHPARRQHAARHSLGDDIRDAC